MAAFALSSLRFAVRPSMKPFLRSFVYAFQGIAYVLRTQRNVRVHIGISVAVIAAAIYFRVTPVEWAILALTIGVVLSVEIINTVAELAVDLLTQRYHPLAKAAKDAAAGAVLIAAIAAVAVGIAIFGPRVWALLFGRNS
jgi:diacylglycerol kinase